MSAFARHRENGQKELGDGCGRLMWLAWGGDAGVDWAQRKLKQIREEQKAVSFSKEGHFKFSLEDEQRRLTGALAIPEKLIMRVDPETNDVYYVYFSKETIRQLAYKFMKNKYMDNVNLEHNPDDKVDATLEESWIVTDPKNDKSKLYGLDLPEGSWVVQYKINSDKVWDMIKSEGS